MNSPTTDDPLSHHAFDDRARRITAKILAGIEDILADMARPDARRAAIEHEARAQCAALLCRQALCRRAGRCRRTPCKVPQLEGCG